MRDYTTAGFELDSAGQFVVIEAKMGSKLSPGTSRVRWYDQAVRNVAAMAWAVDQSGQALEDFDSLAFVVAAPQRRFDEEGTFASYTDKSSLHAKLERRIDLYRDDDPGRHDALIRFALGVYRPFLERLDVRLWSWEEALAAVTDDSADSLAEFYARCLRYNGMEGKGA